MVQLLTIVPDDWSIKKTVKFFNVTEHLKWHENLERERVFWQYQKGIRGVTVRGSMGAVDPPFEKSALFEKKNQIIFCMFPL